MQKVRNVKCCQKSQDRCKRNVRSQSPGIIGHIRVKYQIILNLWRERFFRGPVQLVAWSSRLIEEPEPSHTCKLIITHRCIALCAKRNARNIREIYRSRRIYGRTFVETTNERNDCRALLVVRKFERKRGKKRRELRSVNYNENFLFFSVRSL